MGNLFTRNNQVSPLADGQKMPESKMPDSNNASEEQRHWFKGWFCCDKKATPVVQPTACKDVSAVEPVTKAHDKNSLELKSNISGISDDTELNVEDCDNETAGCSTNTFFYAPKQLQLASDQMPLPKIEDDHDSNLIKSRFTVKLDEQGQTRALAYNVEFMDDEIPNRPASRLSMYNGPARPKRFKDRLPETRFSTTKDIIDRKLSVAVERKGILMQDRSDRLHQKSALSQEMLRRLEAEKQRLLKEKLQEKERSLLMRKERLRRRKEAKALRKERALARTRANGVEKERQSCANAEETLRSKMSAAEENKREMAQEQERKQNAQRYRQIQAYLKNEREAAVSREGENAGDKENMPKQRKYRSCIHFLSKLKREEARRSIAEQEKNEQSSSELYKEGEKYETYEDDSKNPFEEESENEIDPFWNI